MSKKKIEDEVIEVKAVALRQPEVARAIRVTDDASYRAAGVLLARCKLIKQQVNSIFDPIVKAAHTAHKTATGQRAELLKPVEEAETLVRAELGKYAERLEAANREAQVAALEHHQEQEAALEAGGEAEFLPSVAVERGLPEVQGLTYRDVWDFEITNLDAVPREYLMPDEYRIEQVVKAMQGSTNIAGVRVFSRKVPVQR